MIYANLHGNAGNQLFIYAMARSIKKKTGQDICICLHDMNTYFPDYVYSLYEFKLSKQITVDNNFSFPAKINDRFILNKYMTRLMVNNDIFRRVMKRRALSLCKKGIFYWMGEEYLNFDLVDSDDYFINGYWQSPRYFESIRSELLQEIVPLSLNTVDEKLMAVAEKTDSICVSIRRGDYVTNKVIRNQYHVYEDNYYESGVNYIIEMKDDPAVICFSDDIDWAKNNLKFKCPTYFESGNNPICEKLFMMSKCKNFVLSNSTFSWWAEYLCTNNDKIVVAPKKWYADGRPNDIEEFYWHRI